MDVLTTHFKGDFQEDLSATWTCIYLAKIALVGLCCLREGQSSAGFKTEPFGCCPHNWDVSNKRENTSPSELRKLSLLKPK